MRHVLTLLCILACAAHSKAQSSLCLSSIAANRISCSPGELHRFLQLERYKVVLFGEQHNEEFDPEFKYQLITALNSLSGIRHVFMEMSVSGAWHVNQYLQTGDTAHLPAYHSAHAYSPHRLFWKRLREYNTALPDGLKIIIHGVDFETTGVFPTLKELAPAGTPVPPELRSVMDTISAHLSDPPVRMWAMIGGRFTLYDNSEFVRTLRYVQKQVLAHADAAKAFFGKNYPVVYDIATNESPVEVRAGPRNKTMFSAMSRIIREQNIEKFAGFFGGQHTSYAVGNSIANKAARLPGIRSGAILNIAEVAYTTRQKDSSVLQVKTREELAALIGPSCKAAAMPAGAVPGFRKRADVMIVVDLSE